MLGIGERTLYRNIKEWEQQKKIREALEAAHGEKTAAARAAGHRGERAAAEGEEAGVGGGGTGAGGRIGAYQPEAQAREKDDGDDNDGTCHGGSHD